MQTSLEQIRRQMAEAALRAGRAPESVRLVAVSKFHPVETLRAAYAAGQRVFGENRPQELCEKRPQLPADCEWHMIGHLQGNKARQVVRNAAWIHSVNTVELVQRLDRIAGEEAENARRETGNTTRPVILLEINVSGEASKSGATPDAARRLLEEALRSPHLDCRGFMTMAPYDAPEAELRRHFGGLRELRDRLAAESGVPLPELSMGMSGDFGIAIEEGATLIRVGTAIFGGREYGK